MSSPPTHFLARQLHWEKRKSEKQQQLRQRKQHDTEKVFTFKPRRWAHQLTRIRFRSKPVTVNQFDKHVTRHQRGREGRRERNVDNLAYKYGPGWTPEPTIQEPFNLSCYQGQSYIPAIQDVAERPFEDVIGRSSTPSHSGDDASTTSSNSNDTPRFKMELNYDEQLANDDTEFKTTEQTHNSSQETEQVVQRIKSAIAEHCIEYSKLQACNIDMLCKAVQCTNTHREQHAKVLLKESFTRFQNNLTDAIEQLTLARDSRFEDHEKDLHNTITVEIPAVV